jgi:hypothetical protein
MANSVSELVSDWDKGVSVLVDMLQNRENLLE